MSYSSFASGASRCQPLCFVYRFPGCFTVSAIVVCLSFPRGGGWRWDSSTVLGVIPVGNSDTHSRAKRGVCKPEQASDAMRAIAKVDSNHSLGTRVAGYNGRGSSHSARSSALVARPGACDVRTTISLVVILYAGAVSAQDIGSGSRVVDDTIQRGVAFLARDARAWKEKHNCASCHHAGLVVWSLCEAKERGHAVDESTLAELTRWIAESGDGKTSQARPASAPKALNTKALHFAFALAALPDPDSHAREGMTRLLRTVKDDQNENGSWSAWPETRPPIFGSSDETMTALSTLALMTAVDKGDPSASAARDKGVKWLNAVKTDDDPQSVALRLVIWKRLGRPDQECAPVVQRIKDRQNPDGGWSQSKHMASDAWATGQALYALAHAGLKSDDPAIARGHAFLKKTQRADGSWPMTSRPIKPGGKGSESVIPITGAGSAWAVLGLVRSR